MLAVTRLEVDAAARAELAADLQGVLDLLAGKPGFRSGRVGAAVDDDTLLVLSTEWTGAGDYRRALSAYDLKIAFAGLMAHVLDEPSAYEVLAAR